MGGGSVIDTAKSIAAGMSVEGDIWDYYTGAKKSEDRYKKALPIGVILTIAAAGSESSPAAVLSKGHEKLMISSPTSSRNLPSSTPSLPMACPPTRRLPAARTSSPTCWSATSRRRNMWI